MTNKRRCVRLVRSTEPWLLIWTATELAYAAGLMDGEGSILCCGRGYAKKGKNTKKYLTVSVSLNNTDPNMIMWLCERFGGSVHLVRYDLPGYKDLYGWRLSGKKMETFVRAIEPYLVTKKAQAILALKFRETICDSGKSLSDTSIRKRKHIHKQFSELNKRGVG